MLHLAAYYYSGHALSIVLIVEEEEQMVGIQFVGCAKSITIASDTNS